MKPRVYKAYFTKPASIQSFKDGNPTSKTYLDVKEGHEIVGVMHYDHGAHFAMRTADGTVYDVIPHTAVVTTSVEPDNAPQNVKYFVVNVFGSVDPSLSVAFDDYNKRDEEAKIVHKDQSEEDGIFWLDVNFDTEEVTIGSFTGGDLEDGDDEDDDGDDE